MVKRQLLCSTLLALCAGMFGGCSRSDDRDPTVNLPPACAIVAASVDPLTGEVVVLVTISDPDQLRQDIGMEVSLEVVAGAVVFRNNLVTASSGNLLLDSTVYGVAYSSTPPGVATTFRINPTAPQQLPDDPAAVVRAIVRDELGDPSVCELTFDLALPAQPACAVTSPAAGSCVDTFPAGTIPLVFNLTGSPGDPIRFSVCYDAGGGSLPATLTATGNGALGAFVPASAAACAGLANQVVGAATGATTVTWDILADGLGGMLCQNVAVTISPERAVPGGSGAFSTCTQAFAVSNNGAPSCAITAVTDAAVTVSVTDADSAMVTVFFQYSTTGAAGPFTAMTPSAGTNPRAIAPGAGLTFPWASATDVPACAAGVLVRILVDDGIVLANRPATCTSAPTAINCVPVLAGCRTLGEGVALGAVVAPPIGVVPAFVPGGAAGMPPPGGDISGIGGAGTNFWAFDYGNVNRGEFNGTVPLTDTGGNPLGNPVILFSAGHDYSAVMDGGPCNPVDTFQMSIEGTIGSALFDFAPAMTPAAGGTTATVITTWNSTAPGNVLVSPDGLLTAISENSCATIVWRLMSSDPLALIVDPTCAGPFTFAACVDSAGIDTITRQTWLPLGDIDGDMPGLPSGRPAGAGAGGNTACTWIVNSGPTGVATYTLRSEYNGAILGADCGVDFQSVGGSTHNGLMPQLVACNAPMFATVENNASRWNGADPAAASSGIFDLASQTFRRTAAGTTTIHLVNEDLSDAMQCILWVTNPCMPFNSFAPACLPAGLPPLAYFTIAGTASVTVP